MGKLHLRFDEGRGGRSSTVASSPTLPARSGLAPLPDGRGSVRDHQRGAML